MKIVVLDGFTLNPGDLSWEALRELGTVEVFDRTAAEDILERARGAEIILTNKTPLRREVLEQLPKLKFISVLATGFNIIDIEAAKQLGITVSNVPGYSTASVAQLCFALLLEFTHGVQQHSDAVKEGRWARSADFSFWDQPLMELAGKTMGVIGFGDIGKQVAGIAASFGMEVLAYSRTQTDQSLRQAFKWGSLEEVLRLSDVVSLHCPLTEQTIGLINKDALKKMKPTALLINTSRGPLIVEEDLAIALKEGWIAGAGLDVLSTEPPVKNHVLMNAPNCLITPHIAWASVEARSRLLAATINNVKAFLNNNPLNCVS